MTIDIICIHQGEDGTVCGHHPLDHDYWWSGFNNGEPGCDECPMEMVRHTYTPGRKCPTCDGEGGAIDKSGGYGGQLLTTIPCPACAASPVRGYQAL